MALVFYCPDGEAPRIDDAVAELTPGEAIRLLELKPGNRWSKVPLESRPRAYGTTDFGAIAGNRHVFVRIDKGEELPAPYRVKHRTARPWQPGWYRSDMTPAAVRDTLAGR